MKQEFDIFTNKIQSSLQYLPNTKILAATSLCLVIFATVHKYVLLWIRWTAIMLRLDPLTETPSDRAEVPSPSNHAVQACKCTVYSLCNVLNNIIIRVYAKYFNDNN